MAINGYLEAQKENLRRSSRWKPFAEILTLADKLYVDAIALIPNNSPPVFGQVLLICHKSFLSAVALIGQAQPDDAAPITRRAIEAARFAAAIKANPDKMKDWLAYDARMQRWHDRQDGKKPKRLVIEYGKAHPVIEPALDDLMKMHGILSDSSAHFTPEYLFQLDWKQDHESIYLNYFTREQRALEREIILTSGTHLRILEVIDWCLDGAFRSDTDWLSGVETLKETGAPLARKFEDPSTEP